MSNVSAPLCLTGSGSLASALSSELSGLRISVQHAPTQGQLLDLLATFPTVDACIARWECNAETGLCTAQRGPYHFEMFLSARDNVIAFLLTTTDTNSHNSLVELRLTHPEYRTGCGTEVWGAEQQGRLAVAGYLASGEKYQTELRFQADKGAIEAGSAFMEHFPCSEIRGFGSLTGVLALTSNYQRSRCHNVSKVAAQALERGYVALRERHLLAWHRNCQRNFSTDT